MWNHTPPWRSAPAVWAAPLIASLIVIGEVSILGEGEFEPYLDGALARSGVGLQYGLPVAAAASAWAAARSRAIAPPRSMTTNARASIQIWFAHLWPIFPAVGLGYGVSFVLTLNEAQMYFSVRSLMILVTYFAMTITSMGVGWLLGTYLPLAIAAPGSLILVAQWAEYPLSNPNNLSLRNITGYATFMCCDFTEHTIDARAVLAPALIAFVVTALSVGSVRIEGKRFVIPAAVLLTGAVAGALTIAAGSNATATALRPFGQQVCEGTEPEVCTYPEAPTDAREVLNATLHGAYLRAASIPLDLPMHVVAPARDLGEARRSVVLLGMPEANRDDVLRVYAESLVAATECVEETGITVQRSDLPEAMVVSYAIAVALGADPEAVLPSLAILEGGEGIAAQHERALTPERIRELLAVETHGEAVGVTAAWFDMQRKCEAQS